MSEHETHQHDGEARWRPVGGRSLTFYKFQEPGEVIGGVWRGTTPGKFGPNGRLETDDGTEVQFTMSAGLRDLEEVAEGSRIRITFTKWAVSKGGNRFRMFRIEEAAA